jgi:hypothetical protein
MTDQPISNITLNTPTEEIIRIDKEGFHYRGQFIADAGEAHRLMVEFLKQRTMTDHKQLIAEIKVIQDLEAMLDQAIQAAETLRDCWIERTGLKIEDDPYVEDACSTILSIRAERLAN